MRAIAVSCGRLPLAIRIAAARLCSQPNWDLEHPVRRLRDQEQRLVELEAGQRGVTAAIVGEAVDRQAAVAAGMHIESASQAPRWTRWTTTPRAAASCSRSRYWR